MEQRTIMEYEPEQLEPYDFRRAMEEASRWLLCEDAPCTKGCPAGTDPAKFIRSIRFKISFCHCNKDEFSTLKSGQIGNSRMESLDSLSTCFALIRSKRSPSLE
ncbi:MULTISPECIES: hypothetical protein [Bacillaceae]|uniref:hypothetical protein n=1 Tax=Bacillaceae TaxID=186817 RepID=UPI0025599B26|nr:MULTISPECIES: hypothetical protein [Bacillaceae]MEC5272747.1 hypothetical protein [Caldifermentibacillus hisashii]